LTWSVFTKWLWDSRRSLLGWTVGVVAVGGMYAAFWPTINDPALQEALDSYPEGLLDAINYTDVTTPEGYLNATVYGLVVAVLLLIFATAAGARIVAGDEEAGVLDLTLAHPISRHSVLIQRFAAFVTSVVLVCAVFWLAILAVSVPADFTSISPVRFAAMHLHLALFAILFGGISFAVGAATGRRALALAAAAVVGVVAYAASGILPQLAGLEWTRDFSAFNWLNGSEPLSNGVDVAHAATMLGLTLLFVALGVSAFQRRDVAV
jgi:ABC-2 type transport system permease protein